jgi:hypothetical protein
MLGSRTCILCTAKCVCVKRGPLSVRASLAHWLTGSRRFPHHWLALPAAPINIWACARALATTSQAPGIRGTILQKELADWLHRDARTIKSRGGDRALGRDCRPPCPGHRVAIPRSGPALSMMCPGRGRCGLYPGPRPHARARASALRWPPRRMDNALFHLYECQMAGSLQCHRRHASTSLIAGDRGLPMRPLDRKQIDPLIGSIECGPMEADRECP